MYHEARQCRAPIQESADEEMEESICLSFLLSPFRVRDSLLFDLFTSPILVLDRVVFTDRPIVNLIVMISDARYELVSRIFASIPAEEVVAVSAGRESAIVAAKDILPATVLTDLTVPWACIRFVSHVIEVVVVTIDPQSLLEFCQLLLARVWINR